METSGASHSATNILPIPPALEFPFPKETTSAPSTASSINSTSPSGHPNSHTQNGDATASQTEGTSMAGLAAPRPRPVRPQSDKPIPGQRRSLLGMRRGQTAGAQTCLTDGDQGCTSESESEDDGPGPEPRPAHVNGRLVSKKGLDSAASQGRSTSTHNASEDRYSRFSVGNDKYRTKGKVSKRDGRLNISVNETANRGYLAHALGASLKHHLKKPGEQDDQAEAGQDEAIRNSRNDKETRRPDFNAKLSALSTRPAAQEVLPIPTLNIVIMVIGSRGDIQPFLKVGKLLKEYGHRVRIATHPAFKNFVEQDSGLEFFSVGGDPAELMAFMVKNPGLVPSVSTVRAGEIGRRRDAMFEMFQGFWRACINATDEEQDSSNLKMMANKNPFVADAIIANPPSFAHIHCAERLGVPLHLMFTFPYSPTQKFPHPLANIKKSNVDTNYTNFMSYPLVEMMTWQGLGDLVNRFRVKTLGLEPVSTLWAPGQLYRLKVPYTYMWSPGLIPKPEDWGPEIDIAGFVFLDLASSFKPPSTLVDFLDAGEPPVYIGFGSIVVDDPDKFTSLIFEAVEKAGVRALVSKGWGGLGDEGKTPDNIYMLENTPHDWLFPRVSAVVHHGGAGTTAIGLKCGKPTMIVPFFGDQPFWGAMVARAGAGADEPIPYKRLTADALANGIKQCLSPDAKKAAERIAEDIAKEGDGAKNAVDSFLRHLPMEGEHSMRCSILPDHVAVWILRHSNLKLSALAAELLVTEKKIKWHDLRLLRHYEWSDFEGPGEPLTGGGSAILRSAGGVVKGVGGLPVQWAKSIRRQEKKRKKRRNPRAAGRNEVGKHRAKPVTEHHDVKEKSGQLPHGGFQGAEKDLPPSHGILGRVHNSLQKQHSIPKDGVLRPAPSTGGEDDHVSFSTTSESSEDNLAREIAEDTGTGLAQTGEALAKVPMDLSLAIAQGFHNAPRLYGDDTVRTAPRISGIQSGLRAAGSEFVLGVYDGVTGLFLQPYNGARHRGTVGLIQGVGKGIGGFVLKDLAAITGPFGYTMKGIHKELTKDRQPTLFIRKARVLQGNRDMREMDETAKDGELAKVQAAWQIVKEIRKEDETYRQEGVKGRVAFLREKGKFDKGRTYETVGHAQKALETKQEERKKREVENGGTAGGGKERRGSRFIWKMKSIPEPNNRSVGESNSKTVEVDQAANQTVENEAESQIDKSVHNLSHGVQRMDGELNGAFKPETGLTNGSATVAA
ncbi:MAG: hypothetical protein Q9163_000268 [Psora crenata]